MRHCTERHILSRRYALHHLARTVICRPVGWKRRQGVMWSKMARLDRYAQAHAEGWEWWKIPPR